MKNFIIAFIKVIIGEAILIIMLLLCILQTEKDEVDLYRDKIIRRIDGSFDYKTITIIDEIDMGRVKYGKEKSITLSLAALCDSCYIETILTECTCTKVQIDSNRLYNRGDTAHIHISMRGVEYGKQLRRIHILPKNNGISEAKSITLLADVE
ncbi:MAG: DUF1573 domain-containing protein [Marinifilaceae bacterium]|nr:DUF1573 domain-containing protein [Marinifilaceae bacterium]